MSDNLRSDQKSNLIEPTIVRRRAVQRLLWSIVCATPAVIFMIWMTSKGWKFFGLGIGLPLLPVVYFAAELITGIPFAQLSSKWESLAGWQRGVYGTIIVIIGGAAMISVFGFIAIVLLK